MRMAKTKPLTQTSTEVLKKVYKPVRNTFDSFINIFNMIMIKCLWINLDEGEKYLKPIALKQHKYFILDAPTGKGKTHTILECIKNNPDVKFLSITPRTSLSKEMKTQATKRGIKCKHYQDSGFNGKFGDSNYIVIQCESLCKIEDKVDVIILDETTSIFKQFFSGYHENKLKDNIDSIKGLIKSADNVIFADAFINSDIMDKVIEEFFYLNNEEFEKYKYPIQYQYSKDYKPRNVYNYAKHTTFLLKMIHALLNNENIFVVTGSLNESFILYYLFAIVLKSFDKIRYINSKTDDFYLNDLDTNTEWLNYRVVIITGTIVNGIDFSTPNHFSQIFCHSVNTTQTVSDYWQMINRVRNPITSNIHLYYKDSGSEHTLYNNINDVIKAIDINNLHYTSNIKNIIPNDILKAITTEKIFTKNGIKFKLDLLFKYISAYNCLEYDHSTSYHTEQWQLLLNHFNCDIDNINDYDGLDDFGKYVDALYKDAKTHKKLQNNRRFKENIRKYDIEYKKECQNLIKWRRASEDIKFNAEHCNFATNLHINKQNDEFINNIPGFCYDKYGTTRMVNKGNNFADNIKVDNNSSLIEVLASKDISHIVNQRIYSVQDVKHLNQLILYRNLGNKLFKSHNLPFNTFNLKNIKLTESDIISAGKYIDENKYLFKDTYKLQNQSNLNTFNGKLRWLKSIFINYTNISLIKVKNKEEYIFTIDPVFNGLYNDCKGHIDFYSIKQYTELKNNIYLQNSIKQDEFKENHKTIAYIDILGQRQIKHIPDDPHHITPNDILA